MGTDLLRGVIASIRREIERLGGEVRFNTALTGLRAQNGVLTGLSTTAGDIPCEVLVLAVGHSARDTFQALMDGGLAFSCKPFSVGFRAEHLQSEIEKSLYHEAAGHPALPRGEYQLSQQVNGRGGLHLLYVPRRTGGGRGQRGGPGGHQRDELPCPGGPKRQRRRGGGGWAPRTLGATRAGPSPSSGSWKPAPLRPGRAGGPYAAPRRERRQLFGGGGAS